MRWTKPVWFAALAVGIAVTIAAALAVGRSVLMAPSTTSAQPMLEQLDDYGGVPMFALTERSGRRVTLDDLRGYVWIADFIYTECTETCPAQSLQLAAVQQRLSGAADLRLVSITVDPAHDTPEVLRRYAGRYGATERWWFLTGDKREIYCLAQKGFRLSVVDPTAAAAPSCDSALRFGPSRAWASHGSKGLVMHSARLVLVDRKTRIRAYHLATDLDSLASLQKNLRTLLSEPAGRGRGDQR